MMAAALSAGVAVVTLNTDDLSVFLTKYIQLNLIIVLLLGAGAFILVFGGRHAKKRFDELEKGEEKEQTPGQVTSMKKEDTSTGSESLHRE